MRAPIHALAVILLLTTGLLSAAQAKEGTSPDGAAPAVGANDQASADETGTSKELVEQGRLRAGAGLLVLPDLGPSLELGLRVWGRVWLEVEGWLAVSRIDDEHAPPAMGVGPRLSYRTLYPSWEMRGSLAVPILQHDRQYVRRERQGVDEVRDYLVPSFAPGLGLAYRLGPVTLGVDAELVIAMTEYFDYSLFVEETGAPGLASRGTTLTAFPKLGLVAGFTF